MVSSRSGIPIFIASSISMQVFVAPMSHKALNVRVFACTGDKNIQISTSLRILKNTCLPETTGKVSMSISILL